MTINQSVQGCCKIQNFNKHLRKEEKVIRFVKGFQYVPRLTYNLLQVKIKNVY